MMNKTILLLLSLFYALSLTAQSVEEYGIASYYSDKLHGNLTAFGEKYDKNDLTCAHKTLPQNTIVTVTRLDNGKTVNLRVNDRGPFKEGRIVDVSKRAAVILGLVADGLTSVKLTTADAVPAPTPTPKPTTTKKEAPAAPKPVTYSQPKPEKTVIELLAKAEKPKAKKLKMKGTFTVQTDSELGDGFAIQTDALSTLDAALAEVERLEKLFVGQVIMSASGGMYKILIGPIANKKAQDAASATLKANGFKGFFVTALDASAKNTQVSVSSADLKGKFGAQVGVYSSLEKAYGFAGAKGVIHVDVTNPQKPLYKLILGPVADKAAADALRKQSGKKDAFLVAF